MNGAPSLDEVDRTIINGLQGGFPVCERPYAAAAERLGLTEDVLLSRLQSLIERGLLSRFGPLYNAENLGGAVTLAALAAPRERYEEIAAEVNAFPEVAHNYEREHALNMWFVVAVEQPERRRQVLAEIERRAGCKVYDMPKLDKFFIGLRLEV